MLLPVVAGVDGSAESLAAAQWAAREAIRRARPHARRPARGRGPGRDGERAAGHRHLARRVLRRAEEHVSRTNPGVTVEAEQVEGLASGALVRASEGAELLVLGSRGLSGFTGFLVGSVALAVVARAARPVVLVRAGEEAADEHFAAPDGTPSVRTGHRDVVLGLDLGDPCDEVISFGFEAARVRGARLSVVHAWDPPSPFGPGPGEIGLADPPRQAAEWLGFMTAVLQVWRDKFPDVEVVEKVAAGSARSVLVRAASGAGLLVVGRRAGARPTVPRSGPVTHAAVQHVGCPVAVVPHE
ncbi:universal stress protein [Streptomyces sp. NPDC058865]|uniref:universal stress protein n=2 Tax=unclassified Streptomyces TaxID=2593676 RepID=UPI0036B7C16A